MEGINKNKNYEAKGNESESLTILEMIIYSIIGICIFFIPINLNYQTQTLLYHITDKIQSDYKTFIQICIILFISLGSIKSFIKKDKSKIILFFRLLSILILINIFYGQNYIFFKNDNTVLIIKELVFNLSIVLPISAIFMPFILNYGLLEIVESYCHPIMKKLFKVSGKVVLNILIFVFTDCFCGLYMANKLYNQGKLRLNELYMLILNFSIISFSMFRYTYVELSINNLSFIFITLLILILSNMILCRIYPLSKIKKSYYIKTNYRESIHRKYKFKKGINKYLQNKEDKKMILYILDNLEEVINLNMTLIPNILIIFFISDFIFYNEDIVYIFSKIFYPIINMLNLSDVELISKSIIYSFYNEIIAIELINMNISDNIKLLIGLLFVLKGTTLTSNIAYITGSKLELDKKYFILVYLERIFLILILYASIYYCYTGYIM